MNLQKLLFLNRIYGVRITYKSMIVYIVIFLLAPTVSLHRYNVVASGLLLVGGLWLARGWLSQRLIRRALKSAASGLEVASASPLALPNSLHTQIARSLIAHSLPPAHSGYMLRGTPTWLQYYYLAQQDRDDRNALLTPELSIYTVYEIKLSRKLANVIFDSHRAKGQQFRYNFVSAQRVRLEGNFADDFTAYMPQYYQVDTLSYLTPEVMAVMQAAKLFDMEIVDDRLLLFGPLLTGEQLTEMRQLGDNIAKALEDNIDTYSDSYLIDASRKRTIMPFGMQLARSALKPTVVLVGMVLTTLALVAAAAVYAPENLKSWGWLYAVLFIGLQFIEVMRIRWYNRKNRERFLLERRFLEGRRHQIAK